MHRFIRPIGSLSGSTTSINLSRRPLPVPFFKSFSSSSSSSSSSSPSSTSPSFPSPFKSIISPSTPSIIRPLSSNAGAPFVERTAAPVLNPSVWDSLFNKSTMPAVDLSETFPGLPKAFSVPQIPAAHSKVTTLTNGIRVVTLPSVTPVASLGLFVDAGSRYENPTLSGISHFMELMALKSTENRTDFRLVRETMKMGATLNASAGREHFSYSADCLHEFTAPMVSTLGDLVQNHIFHIEELMEEKEMYEEGHEEREKNMDIKMLEGIHEAAYGLNTLGLPLYTPLHTLPNINAESLQSYVKTFFTPQRMVFAAVGVDHGALCDMIMDSFEDLPNDVMTAQHKEKAKYTGGDARSHKRGDQGPTHVAMAWETTSWHDKDLVPMCVLQAMMGGGGSFSAGGPGKGMYSRIYSNVLSKYDWVEHMVAYNTMYSDSGLFGFYAIAHPQKAGELVEVMSKQAIRMTGPVDPVELKRAKNQLTSGLLMQLESRNARLEDVARQLLIYGRVKSISEVTSQIEQVQAEDIQRVAKKMLTTPLSVVAYGDCGLVPRYDQIQKHFK